MSGEALSSYSFEAVVRNDACKSVCDRLLGEAPAGERAGCPEASAELRRLPGGSRLLRLQGRDRGVHGFGRDAPPLEIVANPGVAETTICERGRSVSREALVIEVAEPLEGLDRLRTGRGRNTPALEACRQLGSGQVSPRQRTRSGVERPLALGRLHGAIGPRVA